MESDPRRYLRENALMVARTGQTTRAVGPFGREVLDYETVPIPLAEFMAQTRNLFLQTHRDMDSGERIDTAEFAALIEKMPRAPDELGSFIKDSNRELSGRERTYLRFIHGMGVYSVGVAVGDSKAMQSIIEVIAKFDQTTRSFKP